MYCCDFDSMVKQALTTKAEDNRLCTCAAPQIFLILGMGQKASLLGILIVSGVNLLATVLAIYAVDRQGHYASFLSSICSMSLQHMPHPSTGAAPCHLVKKDAHRIARMLRTNGTAYRHNSMARICAMPAGARGHIL